VLQHAVIVLLACTGEREKRERREGEEVEERTKRVKRGRERGGREVEMEGVLGMLRTEM
jgi:hypothetical protein